MILLTILALSIGVGGLFCNPCTVDIQATGIFMGVCVGVSTLSEINANDCNELETQRKK